MRYIGSGYRFVSIIHKHGACHDCTSDTELHQHRDGSWLCDRCLAHANEMDRLARMGPVIRAK